MGLEDLVVLKTMFARRTPGPATRQPRRDNPACCCQPRRGRHGARLSGPYMKSRSGGGAGGGVGQSPFGRFVGTERPTEAVAAHAAMEPQALPGSVHINSRRGREAVAVFEGFVGTAGAGPHSRQGCGNASACSNTWRRGAAVAVLRGLWGWNGSHGHVGGGGGRQSSFERFVGTPGAHVEKDPWTTLEETKDRLFATSVKASAIYI